MGRAAAKYVINFLEDLLKDSVDKSPKALRDAKKVYGKKLSNLDKEIDAILDRPKSNTVRNVRPVNRDKLEELGISKKDYPGGAYLDPVTGENITSKSFRKAKISTENKTGVKSTEVKPTMKVAEEVDEPLKGSLYKYQDQNKAKKAATKVNLLKPTSTKKKRNWEWKSRNSDIEDTNQLVSIDHRGKHFYALNTRFDKGAKLETYPTKKDEPRLRPLLPEAKLKFGKVIGYIEKSSSQGVKTHPVYENVTAYSEGGTPRKDAKYAGYSNGGIDTELLALLQKEEEEEYEFNKSRWEDEVARKQILREEWRASEIPKYRRSEQKKGPKLSKTDVNIAGSVQPVQIISKDNDIIDTTLQQVQVLVDLGLVIPLEKPGYYAEVGIRGGGSSVNIKDFFSETKGKIDSLEAGLGYTLKNDAGFAGLTGQVDPNTGEYTVGLGGKIKFNKGGTPKKTDIDPVLKHHYKNIKYGKTISKRRPHDVSGTLISSGMEDYVTQTVRTRQVEHPKLNKGKPTLIPLIYDGKELSEKEAIQKAIDSGIKWTSADTHEELREYDKKLHKQMSPELAKGTFKKGGTTMKNNPPVGSTPEEVADDIPAMISEGEFVIPADVVKYIGLEHIREMMHKAKMGLECMEKEGLIVDVDEEGRPEGPQEKDKTPEGEVAILDVVTIEKAEPMVKKLERGGIISPVLNPEEEIKMDSGGMLRQEVGPDGTMRILGLQEGGMPMEMDTMLMEEMAPGPEDELPEMADEMPSGEAEPMPEAPMMNAPVAQVINGVPHLMAYLQEDEIKALHDAGRGIDENGEQILSPEGIPVFRPSEGDGEPGNPSSHGGSSQGQGQGPDPEGMGGFDHPSAGSPPDGIGEPGDMDSPIEKKLTEEDKKELSPVEDTKKFVSGVGFIEKYIEARNSRNPLQGLPQYAVATAAGGGLMRVPEYLQLQEGGMPSNLDTLRESINRHQENYGMPDLRKLLLDRHGSDFDPATLNYLSSNRDVLEKILSDTPGITSEGLISDAKEHYDLRGKDEGRSGTGVYRAQEKFFNPETGRLFDETAESEFQTAAKILETEPDISDESFNYLINPSNLDIFNQAQRTVANEGATYDDVAKQHFASFGKNERRRGSQGLMSLQEDLNDITGSEPGELEENLGGIMSPGASSQPEPEPEPTIGNYTKDDIDEFTKSLEKAKWGNQQRLVGGELIAPMTIDDFFEVQEDGSYIEKANAYGIGHNVSDNRNPVPLLGSEDKRGNPIDKNRAKGIIKAQFEEIDET